MLTPSSILSALIGLIIGLCIVILIHTIRLIRRKLAKDQNGHSPDIELQGHTCDTPHDSLATYTRRPIITTVKTTPEHALSDMDRDIKRLAASIQELEDFHAANFGETGESSPIKHRH